MSWRNYIAILVVLLVATAAILFALRPDPSAEIETEPAVRETVDRLSTRSKSRPKARTRTFVRDERSLRSRGELDDEDRIPAPDVAAEGNVRSPDASQTTQEWADPVNAKVLGKKTWMAPIEDRESERIDDVFERARAARVDPRISHRDRRTSIETVREVVDRCYEDLAARVPGSKGRLIVSWESGATSGSGWVRDVRISVNYKLEDAAFEACILDGAEGLTFAASDGESRTIEYPFFYED